MPVLVELTEQEAGEIANTILRADLTIGGFERAEVRSGYDHDGEPALFVTAIIQEGRDLLPSDLVSRAQVHLLDTLRAAGDRRFPYLRFRWIGDDLADEPPEVIAT